MFKASLVALVTPMTPQGEVDYPSLADLVEFHIQEGTSAIVSVGTTGESATLNTSEHFEVIRYTKEVAHGRIPIIAGTGANSTTEALELTAGAKEIGVDACLLVVPYYNKPTQQGMYAHFAKIASEVAIPQILYNVPGRTVVDMLPETVIALSQLDHIIGIKEATGDISRVPKLLQETGDDFCLLTGEDPSVYEFMKAGGQGIISVTANVAPNAMKRLCEAMLSGQHEQGKQIQEQLMPLHKAMFIEPNPAPTKYALQQMKRCDTGIRLPLLWLSESCRGDVDQALQKSGVLS